MSKNIIIQTIFSSGLDFNFNYPLTSEESFIPNLAKKQDLVYTPNSKFDFSVNAKDITGFGVKQGTGLLHNFVYDKAPLIGLSMDAIVNYGTDYAMDSRNFDSISTTLGLVGGYIGSEVFNKNLFTKTLGGFVVGGLFTASYDDTKTGMETQRIVNQALISGHPNAEFALWLQTENMISRANPAAGAIYTDEKFIRQLVSPGAKKIDPLVFNLNGDGKIGLVALAKSTIFFDMLGRDLLDRTTWIAPEDGMLVIDRNNNGKIDSFSEVFSEIYEKGINNALGALSTLDANHDNIFDVKDAKFSDVKIWQDLNSDGISQENELHSLQSLGVTQINLDPEFQDNVTNEGNSIISEVVGIRNGQDIKIEEIALLTQMNGGYTYVETDNNTKYYKTKDGSILAVGNGTLTVAKDADAIITGTGNDTVTVTSSTDGVKINAGSGSDTIAGNSHDQVVVYYKNKDNYIVNQQQNGSWTVEDKDNHDIDTLINIERIRFDDDVIHTDNTNNNPIVVGGKMQIRNLDSLTITKSELLATATDKDGDYLTIVGIGKVIGGLASLDREGNVV